MKHFTKQTSLFLGQHLLSFILFFVVIFSLVNCASKNPLVRTWYVEYEKGGKDVKLRSVFGNKSYENFATIDDGKEKQLLNGYYKTKDNTITITVTHEFDEQTKKLKKLKTPKTFSDIYIISGDSLIIGKNEK